MVRSSGHSNELLFVHNHLTLRLRQSIEPNEHLTQSYTLTNTSIAAIKLAEGDFGIRIPLPDNYPDAVTALTRRSNVHIWTGVSVRPAPLDGAEVARDPHICEVSTYF